MPFPMFSGGGGEPGAPFGVNASNGGNVSAVVYFTPPDYLGKATVTYSVTSTPVTSTQIFSASGQTFTGLTNGTSYTFVVRTLTDYSVYSEPSDASSAITPVAPPPSFAPGPSFPPYFPVDACAGVVCPNASCDGAGNLVNGPGYSGQYVLGTAGELGVCSGCAGTPMNVYTRACCDPFFCFTGSCPGCTPPPCTATGVPGNGTGWTAIGSKQYLAPTVSGATCNPRYGENYSVWQLYIDNSCGATYNLFTGCSTASF